MNIALLIPTLSGGGAERVAQIIGDYYVGKGYNVYYFLGDTGIRQVYPVKGKVIQTGIESCRNYNDYGDLQVVLKLIKASLQMRKWKRKYHIDVAISFMEEFNYINVLSRGREKVITRICTIISEDPGSKGIFFNKNIVRFFYNKSDKVIVLCDESKIEMHKIFGVSLNKIVKIPNPAMKVNLYREKENWEYGKKVIITVGRLVEQKQQERIIRAFSYVYKHENSAKLLILGVGPKEKYLKEVSRRCGVEEQVIFAGFKNDIAYFLRHSRVFVMSSLAEGMPNSMLEAMACGVPVVSTDSYGGCGELLGKRKYDKRCKDILYCRYGILTPHIFGRIKLDQKLEPEEVLLGQALLEMVRDDNTYNKYRIRSLKRAEMYETKKIMLKWNELLGKKVNESGKKSYRKGKTMFTINA